MDNISIKPELMHCENKAGLRQIYIRITQNKKHIRKKVGIAVKSNEWENTHGAWVTKKNPEHKFYNTTIQSQLTKYEKQYLSLKEESNDIDKKDVFVAVNKINAKRDFLSYWDEIRKEMKEFNNYKGYDTTRKKIIEFEGSDKFDFKLINMEWLVRFENWLKGKDLCNESIHGHQKRLRKVWNVAISNKVIDNGLYPFGRNGYKLPNISTKTKKIERLDVDELKVFFKLQYDRNELIYYVHKGFELSFNCAGIRIEDLLTLKWSNVKNGRISYNMKKGVTNGKLKTFEITQSIKNILDGLKLDTSKQTDYLLPFLSIGIEKQSNENYKKEIGRKTSLYNKYLKKIAIDIGTEKNLTSHLARHSWAAFTYEKTNDLKLIQENLGQNDIKVTMGYIGRLSTKKNDEKLKSLYTDLY
jgi:integrase/recombinase XerD